MWYNIHILEERTMSKCPCCGYWAFNGQECFDCGYRASVFLWRIA